MGRRPRLDPRCTRDAILLSFKSALDSEFLFYQDAFLVTGVFLCCLFSFATTSLKHCFHFLFPTSSPLSPPSSHLLPPPIYPTAGLLFPAGSHFPFPAGCWHPKHMGMPVSPHYCSRGPLSWSWCPQWVCLCGKRMLPVAAVHYLCTCWGDTAGM